MIHPQLVPHATMLVYILTDAAIEPAVLDSYLRHAIELSFNRISVDGDTSTNDTVLLLASGASGAAIGPGNAGFRHGPHARLHVARAPDRGRRRRNHPRCRTPHRGRSHDADALRVAKAIAHSPLVKTAWAGCDPNWGRLVAAIGYSGAQIDPEAIDISFGELPICRNGGRAAGVRRSRGPRLHPATGVLHLHPAPPGRRLLHLLDHRPDPRVHPHQRRLHNLASNETDVEPARPGLTLQTRENGNSTMASIPKSKPERKAKPAPPKETFSLISHEKLLAIYTAMLKCRMVEQRAAMLFQQGKLASDLHASFGREATAPRHRDRSPAGRFAQPVSRRLAARIGQGHGA